MTAEIIDGKAFALDLRRRVAQQAAGVKERHGLVPGLSVVIVGDDPASQVYVRNKGKVADEMGFRSDTVRLPEDTEQADLIATVAGLNADPGVHGILVQLPLPEHLDEAAVVDAVDPDKDVDGLHVVNAGRLAAGLPAMVPCTPLGCMMLLRDRLGEDGLVGQRALVVGRSNLVGKPMAQLLLAQHCTVTIAHSRTRDLPGLCREADILIAAVGRPRMLGGDCIKPGAVVIDVGINRIDAGEGKTRLVGDVDFEQAVGIAGAITPVPGGIGPMTVACLMANTLTAACRAAGIEEPAAE
ncbi:MAG: bifunctional methylenetetrahydrofolate dehydrogenase/methenyltetrahydrofolate cyclohydrolase FolD [Alphaproteobacteria bacterium]|jgi:methylenetetrahydrofolate dehydrogenase (NADP+)/methenyltetrahydrofolate cyclohydrolase|nr:bifunctional methylenetetrahydrofolate dehydrogenase/methenyltetrahydrofolate cyclohydrolase FolD [Alphaproteobacteria bacterium]MDP6563602.1 bifunctional methylenetetrahydrofolate dehydrogenase/methenyltetrahydrofolate cyclohydrolase FolD [Alphaproteobacteria bacterium]MDP6815085.1 bifunctional methylenetetrahydrofolate dehydrogenase/methenyltetrahydrofolate cyclohydrolase FolD [Alphaproteobacteria bacterium]